MTKNVHSILALTYEIVSSPVKFLKSSSKELSGKLNSFSKNGKLTSFEIFCIEAESWKKKKERQHTIRQLKRGTEMFVRLKLYQLLLNSHQ